MSFYQNIAAVIVPGGSDEMLLQQLADGNQQAFADIYNYYWEDLFITAARALQGEKEAADVVQDVFLSLWKRRNELNLEGSLAAYLHTSVRYKCIHYIEKNITRRDYLVRFAEVAISASLPKAEINLQLKEMQQTINNAVAKMPPKMQEVYKLSRQEQLSFKEIAERMNISVATVKKHIQHALRLIRKDLTTYVFIFIILVFYHAR